MPRRCQVAAAWAAWTSRVHSHQQLLYLNWSRADRGAALLFCQAHPPAPPSRHGEGAHQIRTCARRHRRLDLSAVAGDVLSKGLPQAQELGYAGTKLTSIEIFEGSAKC